MMLKRSWRMSILFHFKQSLSLQDLKYCEWFSTKTTIAVWFNTHFLELSFLSFATVFRAGVKLLILETIFLLRTPCTEFVVSSTLLRIFSWISNKGPYIAPHQATQYLWLVLERLQHVLVYATLRYRYRKPGTVQHCSSAGVEVKNSIMGLRQPGFSPA